MTKKKAKKKTKKKTKAKAKAKKKVTVVKCPHCGNEDLEKMFYGEWVTSQRRIHGMNKNGTLFISTEDEVITEASKDAHVFCDDCQEEFELPVEIGLEFADEVIEDEVA